MKGFLPILGAWKQHATLRSIGLATAHGSRRTLGGKLLSSSKKESKGDAANGQVRAGQAISNKLEATRYLEKV